MKMSLNERSECLKDNPVTAVRIFQYQLETLFDDYILDTQNSLGEISDHVIKIEFQGRGSSHAHCLLWVKGAPCIVID